VQTEHHRARRYPFQSYVELTDLQSDTQTRVRTSNLSLFGCHVESPNPLEPGTKVSVSIAHAAENFRALGRVAYAQPGAGMGIVFTTIQPSDQLVLEEWIDELRTK
jgi:hypothetical protein